MRFLVALVTVGLATIAAGAPSRAVTAHKDSSPQTVVYWGQNGGGIVENNDLSSYCQPNSGIDVIVLAFLYEFGGSGRIPSGTIGQSCYISQTGEGQNCDNVKSSIAKCRAAGVKIIISLGGATSSYSLQSQEQAESLGQYLWDSYGNSGTTNVQRPFGDSHVDGFDFDIENSLGAQYYQYLIAKLRANFSKDSSQSYYITGAPQCPIPEPNMGEIISTAKFDYLFVQFYNNNNYTVPCALPINGNAAFNYANWTSFISNTPSKDARIFIGVPASTLGANGMLAGASYFATPDQLADIVKDYRSDSHFGGIMMWNAGFSDSNMKNGCTYAQQATNILTNGVPCDSYGLPVKPPPPPAHSSSAPPPPPVHSSSAPPPPLPPATSTTTTATAAMSPQCKASVPQKHGVIAQWGQVRNTMHIMY